MIAASPLGTLAVKTSADAATPAPAEASPAPSSPTPGQKASTPKPGVAASFGDALRAYVVADDLAGGAVLTLKAPTGSTSMPVADLKGPPLNDVVGWQRMRYGHSTNRTVTSAASMPTIDPTQGGTGTAAAIVPAAPAHSTLHSLGAMIAPVNTPQVAATSTAIAPTISPGMTIPTAQISAAPPAAPADHARDRGAGGRARICLGCARRRNGPAVRQR